MPERSAATTPADLVEAVSVYVKRDGEGCPHMSACQCVACEMEIYDALAGVRDVFQRLRGDRG